MMNKVKSGIMVLFKRGNGAQDKGEVLGYPHVDSYKYLGTLINSSLGNKRELESVARKVTILKSRWVGIMKTANL